MLRWAAFLRNPSERCPQARSVGHPGKARSLPSRKGRVGRRRSGPAVMSIEPRRKPESLRIAGAAVLGIAAPALVTPLALAIFGREDLPNVAILYLLVIAVVSLRLGYRPSLLAAVTSAL